MFGTILLDYHDRYLVQGELPIRPEHDKDLLRAVVSCGYATPEGKLRLPESIRKVKSDSTVAVTIPELALADLLLVNRTMDMRSVTKACERFRLDNHEYIGKVEVWLRKKY